ncbi:hypothetical protein OB955_13705 [Halobacteria archaeon AArc-m2/3/4]|uniref:Uncharacterized protein n=1 Tax=Natronoglomus mannanivorans TaxID=2979990 RepID=A0ABT2QFW4_9EURY|nr:hypothetical protein [Halobacteria archaeon AArc-m2/3/4]
MRLPYIGPSSDGQHRRRPPDGDSERRYSRLQDGSETEAAGEHRDGDGDGGEDRDG